MARAAMRLPLSPRNLPGRLSGFHCSDGRRGGPIRCQCGDQHLHHLPNRSVWRSSRQTADQAQARMADGMNAVGAATSPARPPDPGYRLRRAQAPAAPPQGRTRRQQTSCPAEDRRARCRVEGNGHLTIRIVQPGALVTRTQPVGRWPVQWTGQRHRASPTPARAISCTMQARTDLNEAGCQHGIYGSEG